MKYYRCEFQDRIVTSFRGFMGDTIEEIENQAMAYAYRHGIAYVGCELQKDVFLSA